MSGAQQADELKRNIGKCEVEFVYNTGDSTTSAISGKIDNSALVKMVYSASIIGACIPTS